MEKLTGSLQENLLTLLVYSDKDADLIANTIELEQFESSIFREIASVSIDYLRQFKKPIAEHLPDVLEHRLRKEDRKSTLYEEVIKNLYWAKDVVNREYVVSQLQEFVRKQNMKISVKEAIEYIQSGDLDKAESALESYRKKQIRVFDVGTRLKDFSRSLRFLSDEFVGYDIDIPLLDSIDIKPAPKELFTFVALPRRGKTWFLIHVGRFNYLNRRKILHITLEMAEEKISMRYIQNLFAITKRQAEEILLPKFKKDDRGHLLDIDFLEPKRKRASLSLDQRGIYDKITNALNRIRPNDLIIKEFPTRRLTISGLKSYLDMLESLHGFVPDIILLDYADIMYIDSNNLRIDTGRTYGDLRGLAQERFLAMVTASQANREAEKAQLITGRHLAEDFSKFAISDNIITYTQTPLEKKCNLARLYVEKGRGDRTGDTILISQDYEHGQFCLDCARIQMGYTFIGDKEDKKEE